MRKLVTLIAAMFSLGTSSAALSASLDYDQMILLDAEDLAETGIKEAYERVQVSLKKYVPNPLKIEELIDSDTATYAVTSGGVQYKIYSKKVPETESWGNATYAFFSIVNRQLMSSNYRFYAINGGNDLGGMFLTKEQYKGAIASIKKKTDWPYIPTQENPWYGQPR